MRLAIPFAVLLVAGAAPRHGCGNGTPAYDPCAGKACGETCHLCAPDVAGCVETMELKACDPSGRCVPQVNGMCAGQGQCSGKSCGAPCAWPDLPCLYADPPCLPPQGPGYCDANGVCAQGYPPPDGACPPSWGCVGKRCGDSCGYCPPGADPANCPVPTFAATACDPQLQCVTVGTFTCPADLCAGKKCGEACDPCGGMCMNPIAYYCDASNACVPGTVTCPP